MAGAKRRQLKLEWPSRRVGTLFAVGSLLVALELLYESNAFFFMPYTNVFAKFVFHIFASVGEFLVIGATVAYLFSRVEQFEFMNNILDQRDVLTEVSNAGVVKMVPNPRDTMYEEELKNHEKIIICLRGSLSFFHLRQRLILDRLDDKKEIKVYCDSENIAVIEGWKLQQESRGVDVSRFTISESHATIMYNFLECDTGIWIKTYFSSYKSHKTAAPAFFIRSGSPLFETYRQDLDLVMGIQNANA